MIRLNGVRFLSISRSFLQKKVSPAKGVDATKVVSSCLVGTKLNLDIKKGKPGPVALDDSGYPDWLWTVLKDNSKKAKTYKPKEPISPDNQLGERRKQLRKENRSKIKQNNFISQL
ncbi:similar to Saccharomyces cerevisiae YBR268W MRPL37 Mitochondrial ribosomal protein of the large subunit [Maudiozyma barnettii]|uniref:Large ribosomal subunit protein mL54 n=1 Tax=Maudiozyma barnettii TaxID=61262 RepID=A0A8H2ZHJ0_9SACH|nr:mitochondrial 54S ribosomal protein YmL37 [Kazachstania barnettii]CAB4254552.1 similar to Saccharomyces cerevisiae YBR268W MRPL37 Mitochondrial ribosomal protein of the large subunit [Kazachstania barnettii]CAD1782594.1 similar to Saccharomyces cerevisiae YBR268W MRPL37 Mitochondrial ribosomal protein of the large subunit [Kazachstania barnettii]